MSKFRRLTPTLLVALPFLAPTFTAPAVADSLKQGNAPFCPPPPTQKVANLTFNIEVSGTHKTEGRTGYADIQRSRLLKGVVRMVYNGESDHDDLDPNSAYGTVVRTPDVPDGFTPGKTPIIDGKRDLGGAVGGLAKKMQTRIAECQKKGGPNVMACQMEAVKAIGAEADRQCDPDDPKSKEKPICAAIYGGGDDQIASPPSGPGQCVPGKKGVASGPFENWVSNGCTVEGIVDDRGVIHTPADHTYDKLEASAWRESGTEKSIACQVVLSISKMDNTASIFINWGNFSVPTTISVGGEMGKSLVVNGELVAPQNRGSGENSALQTKNGSSTPGSRSVMDWSTEEAGKKLFLHTPMNNSGPNARSNFQGAWAGGGNNPLGAKRHGFPGKNVRTDSKTTIRWHFDATRSKDIVTK